MDFSRSDKEHVQQLVFGMMSKKLSFNNYYGLDLSDVDYIITDCSLLIRKHYRTYSRLYIMSTNGEDLGQLLCGLPCCSAINIPSRNGIDQWEKVLYPVGFKNIGIYKRYYNVHFPVVPARNIEFASKLDIGDIYNILYSNFSPIADRLPDYDELLRMIDNKQIIVNRNQEEKVSGLHVHTFEGKKCYMNYWVDTSSSGRGLLLLFQVYFLMREHGINYAYFWVREGNAEVEQIHGKLGAKFDGLKDYSFLI